MPTGNIRPQHHGDIVIQQLTHRSNPRRKVAVRSRTMDGIDPIACHQCHLIPIGIDAMRHQRGRIAKHTIATIGIAVASGLGFQLAHPRYLRAVFAEVRLHRQMFLTRQISQSSHHFGRTTGYKTRSNNSPHTRHSSHMSNQNLGITHSLSGRISQGIRTVTVHTYHPYQCTQTCLVEIVGKDTRRLTVNGSKNDRAHCATPNQPPHKIAIHLLRISGIRKTRLFGKSVSVEPRQQFQVHRQAHIAELWRMDVHIVHCRNKKRVAEIGNRHIGILFGNLLTRIGYIALFVHRDIPAR